MFSAAPMVQLSLVALERDQRTILEELGRLGVDQLTSKGPGPTTAPLAARNRAGELAACAQLLARATELRRKLELGITPAGETPAASLEQAEQTLKLLEAQANDLLQKRERLSHRWAELSALREQVSPYCGLAMPLDEPGSFGFLHFVAGTLRPDELEQLRKEVGEHAALLPLTKGKERQPLIVLTTQSNRPALTQILERAGFKPEHLPAVRGATADTLSSESRREQNTVEGELGEVQQQIQRLAAEALLPLAAIERRAQMEQSLLEAAQNCPRTETTILLSGWVPAAEAPALERHLTDITAGRCVTEIVSSDRLAEESVPVLLRHPRWLRPFERLVAAYGLPRYQELEPTLFVAVSFVLMFGMMFGDAGHGLVLALGGVLALAAGRTEKVRDLGLLVLLAGISSIVFGVVYGSYFGLAQFKRYALWHDPLEGDAMALMRGAIAMGVGMISLGLILNIINRFRSGDVLGGLLDKFGAAGVLFYWGSLALIARYSAIQSHGWLRPMLLLCVGLPVAGWMLKGLLEQARSRRTPQAAEPESGLFATVAESLVGAFEGLLSYLANTISFVRLAAYAMSHAALLAATFMMAAEVRRASVAGSVLVIILGNLVAMVLEGVIASVQALRLEYYEFFGKFFSGAGQAFKPFRLLNGSG